MILSCCICGTEIDTLKDSYCPSGTVLIGLSDENEYLEDVGIKVEADPCHYKCSDVRMVRLAKETLYKMPPKAKAYWSKKIAQTEK